MFLLKVSTIFISINIGAFAETKSFQHARDFEKREIAPRGEFSSSLTRKRLHQELGIGEESRTWSLFGVSSGTMAILPFDIFGNLDPNKRNSKQKSIFESLGNMIEKVGLAKLSLRELSQYFGLGEYFKRKDIDAFESTTQDSGSHQVDTKQLDGESIKPTIWVAPENKEGVTSAATSSSPTEAELKRFEEVKEYTKRTSVLYFCQDSKESHQNFYYQLVEKHPKLSEDLLESLNLRDSIFYAHLIIQSHVSKNNLVNAILRMEKIISKIKNYYNSPMLQRDLDHFMINNGGCMRWALESILDQKDKVPSKYSKQITDFIDYYDKETSLFYFGRKKKNYRNQVDFDEPKKVELSDDKPILIEEIELSDNELAGFVILTDNTQGPVEGSVVVDDSQTDKFLDTYLDKHLKTSGNILLIKCLSEDLKSHIKKAVKRYIELIAKKPQTA